MAPATATEDWPPPPYDDRAPKVVKVIDPVVQLRNKHNRQRGKRAERVWADVIDAMSSEKAVVRGILGGADVTWDAPKGSFAFEVKHRHMGWPSNTVIKNALVQAANNAGNRTPVVVACMTTGNSRSWRVYSAVKEFTEGKDWLRGVLA